MMSVNSGHFSKPHRTWASAPLPQTSAACLVGVASLVLALKRDGILGTLGCLSWFPGRRTISEEDYIVPGLYNFRNNCFINVILQALAACSYFQSFLEEIIVESERLIPQERSEILPLVEALDALVEGLCVLSEKKVTLNPSQVMKEISHHCPSFNLMVQQDANEALGLLINALREELLGCYCYIPHESSLAVASASNGRILRPEVANDQSERERWQKHYLGPFDGIISGIVTCQTCSTQLALDFEFFYTIFAIPVPTHGSAIGRHCTLIDCLRQYFVAQRENSHCTHCWHANAASYLSSMVKNDGEIKKVEACTRADSCECRSLPVLSTFPWLDSISRIVLRKRIARPPEILCIELSRATDYGNGNALKLKGHIPFPLVLDLSPFISWSFGVNMQGNLNPGPWFPQQRHVRLRSAPFNTRIERGVQSCISEHTKRTFNVTGAPYESHQPMQEELPDARQVEGCSNVSKAGSCSESADKKSQTARKDFGNSPFYRLVSVVEHFGEIESGHYTVYRSVRSNPLEEGHTSDDDGVQVRWFRISDTEVVHASEEEVLAANACILFYERVPEEDIIYDD